MDKINFDGLNNSLRQINLKTLIIRLEHN